MLEVAQNKASRIALIANRQYMIVEAIREDTGWGTFREKLAKAIPRYRVMLQRTDESTWLKMCLNGTFMEAG